MLFSKKTTPNSGLVLGKPDGKGLDFQLWRQGWEKRGNFPWRLGGPRRQERRPLRIWVAVSSHTGPARAGHGLWPCSPSPPADPLVRGPARLAAWFLYSPPPVAQICAQPGRTRSAPFSGLESRVAAEAVGEEWLLLLAPRLAAWELYLGGEDAGCCPRQTSLGTPVASLLARTISSDLPRSVPLSAGGRPLPGKRGAPSPRLSPATSQGKLLGPARVPPGGET